MEDVRKIKKVLGVLVHLSEHRGRSLIAGELEKSQYYQHKTEKLKGILVDNWNDINKLLNKFNEFQKLLNTDRENY